jgi:hypothetical protein
MSAAAEFGLADDPDEANDRLDLVLCSAGGWTIGIEAAQVSGAWPATSAMASDCATASALIGLPTAPEPAPQEGKRTGFYLLSLKQPEQEVVVNLPVEFVSLPFRQIHPLPALLAARTRLRGLRAVMLPAEAGGQNVALLFDSGTWA